MATSPSQAWRRASDQCCFIQTFGYVLRLADRVTLNEGEPFAPMRVVNREERSISYTLNMLGLRVFDGMCELIARQGNDWVSIGSAKKLPVDLSVKARQESDPLLLTVSQ